MKKKIYSNNKEKTIDFLVGLIGVPVVFISTLIIILTQMPFLSVKPQNVAYYQAMAIIWLSVIAVELIAAVYMGIKRKFIGIGILFSLVLVPLVLSGACLLMSTAWK